MYIYAVCIYIHFVLTIAYMHCYTGTSDRLLAAGHRLQAKGERLQATSYRLQATGCKLQVASYRVQAGRLQATG